MARTVKLHPVTVMLGLLIGGTLAGLVGMLLTVPVIACTKIVLLHLWDSRVQWPPQEPAVPQSVGVERGEPAMVRGREQRPGPPGGKLEVLEGE
jgi:hypothetical protein